jgi:predicted CXXCH cytochrome family protein
VRFRFAAVLLCCLLPAADEQGKIMRPPDGSSFRSGPVDIIATAPGGTLEVDGKQITAEQPFPNVLHAKAEVAPGVHKLALVWPDGRKEIRFHTGPAVPAGFEPFRQHPPVTAVPCTQCHELSRRGRFVFKGGCFDCHQDATFARVHTHAKDVLQECGLCHNAHGSTKKSHLVFSREVACKQCHT